MWGLCKKYQDGCRTHPLQPFTPKQFGQAVETEIVLSDEQGNSGVC
jgi:hypothetical protein